jgi:hypothetical protein
MTIINEQLLGHIENSLTVRNNRRLGLGMRAYVSKARRLAGK